MYPVDPINHHTILMTRKAMLRCRGKLVVLSQIVMLGRQQYVQGALATFVVLCLFVNLQPKSDVGRFFIKFALQNFSMLREMR